MDARTLIYKGERELKAEIASSLHGFISQGLSLKEAARLEADKESILDKTRAREGFTSRLEGSEERSKRGGENLVVGQHQAATGTPMLCIFMNCIAAGPAASVAIFCCRDQDTAGAFSQNTLSNEWPQWLPMTNTSHSLCCWRVKAFTELP